MADQIKTSVRNFDKFMGRRDIKEPWWFKLSNKITEDPELYDLSGDEFKAFIYIASTASKKRAADVVLVRMHAERVANINWEALRSVVQKLTDRGILTQSDLGTEPVRDPGGAVRDPGASVRDPYGSDCDPYAIRGGLDGSRPAEGEGEGDLEGKEKAPDPVPAPPIEPHWLVQVWNTHAGPGQPRVDTRRKLHASRMADIAKAVKFNPSQDDWIKAAKAIATSEFCLGGKTGKGWKANFDYFIKPKNMTKALEGGWTDTSKHFEHERPRGSHQADVDECQAMLDEAIPMSCQDCDWGTCVVHERGDS